MAMVNPGAKWKAPANDVTSAEPVRRASEMITAKAPRFMAV